MVLTKRWTAAIILASLLLSSGVRVGRAASLATEVSSPVKRDSTSATPFAMAQDQRYAEREKRDPSVADFRGGDSVGIYIGGSAGLIIVLLLILIILR